jgi:hypothetical protein
MTSPQRLQSYSQELAEYTLRQWNAARQCQLAHQKQKGHGMYQCLFSFILPDISIIASSQQNAGRTRSNGKVRTRLNPMAGSGAYSECRQSDPQDLLDIIEGPEMRMKCQRNCQG